jgi:hypothetical protein
MNNYELKSIISGNAIFDERFIGVFPADKLPNKIQIGQFYILNTAPARKPGQHWVTVYHTNRSTIEVFDSYGISLEKYNKQWETFFFLFAENIVQNTRIIQNLMTNVCGEHALTYIHLRLKGVSFGNIVNKFYTDDTCANDEKVVNYVKTQLNVSDLELYLDEPIITCKSMHLNLL